MALPFLCVLATTPEVSERLGKRHKTVAMWTHQMLSLVRCWLPDRELKLMGDTAYTVLELGLHAKAQQVTLIMTDRLDAVLHDPPPERTQHTIGRPRVVGNRQPALETVLQDSETVWQQLTLDWYGEGERSLEMCTGTVLWYRYGSAPLPIRWVLIRDPSDKRPPKATFSTDPAQTAEQIVRGFMKCWSLEVTFEEGVPIWVSRHNVSGQTWLLSARRLCSLASTASSPSLGKPCIRMAAFLSLKRPGIAAGCYLSRRARRRQAASVGLGDFSHITH